MIGKTAPPQTAIESWREIFRLMDQELPRVGRKLIDNPSILQKVQALVTDKDVRCLVACRGPSRTIAPPQHMTIGEAPYRKSIFTSRDKGEILVEDEWEFWENLAKRQVIRPSHASHINITMFACNPEKAPVVEAQGRERALPSIQTSPENCPDNPQAITQGDGLTKAQHCDLQNPKQPEAFLSLSKEEQSALVRCYKNLGHPSPERLSTVLRQQGYRPEVAKAALGYQCSICQAGVQPKGQRPSSLREEMDFNDRISIDGVTWTNSKGQNFHFYHIVDWATNFQAACIAPSPKFH